jgi:hypothetical protein
MIGTVQGRILLGVLGDPKSDMRIGFVDGCWTLATGEGDSYEVLARHENWGKFIELIGEYSDYDGADLGDDEGRLREICGDGSE